MDIPGHRLGRGCTLPLVLLLVLMTPLRSAALDLYSATAPVVQEGAEGRNQAIAEALVIVLQKLSGRPDIEGRTGLQALLDTAPGAVQQFRFQNDSDGSRRLWVRFDSAAVDRGLRDLGLPVWSSNRPRTLVWVAIERDGRRELFNPESHGTLMAALRRQADQRGLPLVLPLMDLEDQTRLNVGDLWNAFEAPVRAASQRYRHDAILIGRMRQLDRDRWSGRWTLLLPGSESLEFDGDSGPMTLVAGSAVDLTVDRIAARLAPVDAGDGPGRLALRVSGIDELPDYANVLQALQGQRAIQRLVVRYVAGDQLQLDVWVNGSIDSLRRDLTGDDRFVPDLTPAPVPLPPSPPVGGTAAGADPPDDGTATPAAEPTFDIAYRWVG